MKSQKGLGLKTDQIPVERRLKCIVSTSTAFSHSKMHLVQAGSVTLQSPYMAENMEAYCPEATNNPPLS